MDMVWVVWKRPVTIYEPLERPINFKKDIKEK